MNIIEVNALSNGAHRNQNNASVLPDGWAVIPDGFSVPDTFPFVGLEVEEVTCYREVEVEKEVAKTREVEAFDEEGNPVTVTEEYTETETVTEQEPYTVLTVTSMTAGEMPEVEETEIVTQLDRIEAQATYTAMMTDTLLEEG